MTIAAIAAIFLTGRRKRSMRKMSCHLDFDADRSVTITLSIRRLGDQSKYFETCVYRDRNRPFLSLRETCGEILEKPFRKLQSLGKTEPSESDFVGLDLSSGDTGDSKSDFELARSVS